MREIKDSVVLVISPAPEHHYGLIHVYLQLLLLFIVGKLTRDGLLEVDAVAQLFHAGVHAAQAGVDLSPQTTTPSSTRSLPTTAGGGHWRVVQYTAVAAGAPQADGLGTR